MALEGERTRGRKKIKLPSGDLIEIPVITSISFVDPNDRYQETKYTIDNTTTGGRTVHVDDVHPVDVDANGAALGDPPIQDTNTTLRVERVDEWPIVDASDRHQETRVRFDSTTGNDQLPPHFSTHLATHIYRYYQNPENADDSGVWVDSELIDQITTLDANDRYQESVTTLRNPARDDMAGQASPDDPDITEYDDDGDPVEPVRTDPFQNIVNYSAGTYIVVQFTWQDSQWSPFNEYSAPVPPFGHQIYAGVPSELIDLSDNNDIEFDEAGSHGVTLIDLFDTSTANPTAGNRLVELAGMTDPIRIFGPCWPRPDPGYVGSPAVCPGPNYPGDPTDVYYSYDFSATVDMYTYTETFLFTGSPSPTGESAPAIPTRIRFNVSNTEPTGDLIRTVGSIPLGPDQTQTRGSNAFRFYVYIFSSSRVDLYPNDKKLPLRKKDLPTDVDPDSDFARALTFDVITTRMILHPSVSFTDTSQQLHNALQDGSYEIRFESFNMKSGLVDNGDNKNHGTPWPKLPEVTVIEGYHLGRYSYEHSMTDVSVDPPVFHPPIKPKPPDDPYIDMGQPPV